MAKRQARPLKNKVAKVPVVMQLEALECGAAALAMVMAYYGKWVPLEQVRLDCGVSRDGSNAKNIYLAAQNYGFDVKAVRTSPEALRNDGVFPCIIHWNMNHFVVLDGFAGKHVWINDPGRGRLKISWEEFDRSFTGVVITPVPGEHFVPGGRRKSTIAFAAKRLKGAGPAVIFVMMTTVITYLFGIFNSGVSRVFLDRILTGRNPEWVPGFFAVLCGLAVIQMITAWIQAVYSLRINGKMSVIGSTSYMWKVLHLPMEFFSQRLAGDIQSRQSLNASVAQTLVSTFAPLLLNSIMMVFYLAVMLKQSVLLTCIGLLTLLMNTAGSMLLSRRRINIARVQMRDASKLESATVSGISMIETIKAGGAETGFFRKWAGYQASVNAQNVKAMKTDLYFGMIPSLLSTMANYAVLITGLLLTMQEQFTLGAVMMFQGFLSSFMAPATKLIGASQTIHEMRTQMERVEDVMEYRDDPNAVNTPETEKADYRKLRGDVELKHVTFGYSPLGEPLLNDFSLHVKQGQKIALVGASGCGKSTVSKLISGLYDPWKGEILFDGKPRSAYPREVMTGSLGIVDQEIILFEATVADNIRMWDNTIMDFEVILAARDAQIHDDIMQMEGGYNHKLLSGGRNLSGGQRQRIEIARVLAQDPTVIIMDEATSALDAKTEHELVKAVSDRGITCIVIAHRLSTIRDCDEIIVMEHGVIKERGTHEQLMEQNGLYTALVSNE